jgi:hypothetical protein
MSVFTPDGIRVAEQVKEIILSNRTLDGFGLRFVEIRVNPEENEFGEAVPQPHMALADDGSNSVCFLGGDVGERSVDALSCSLFKVRPRWSGGGVMAGEGFEGEDYEGVGELEVFIEGLNRPFERPDGPNDPGVVGTRKLDQPCHESRGLRNKGSIVPSDILPKLGWKVVRRHFLIRAFGFPCEAEHTSRVAVCVCWQAKGDERRNIVHDLLVAYANEDTALLHPVRVVERIGLWAQGGFSGSARAQRSLDWREGVNSGVEHSFARMFVDRALEESTRRNLEHDRVKAGPRKSQCRKVQSSAHCRSLGNPLAVHVWHLPIRMAGERLTTK